MFLSFFLKDHVLSLITKNHNALSCSVSLYFLLCNMILVFGSSWQFDSLFVCFFSLCAIFCIISVHTHMHCKAESFFFLLLVYMYMSFSFWNCCLFNFWNNCKKTSQVTDRVSSSVIKAFFFYSIGYYIVLLEIFLLRKWFFSYTEIEKICKYFHNCTSHIFIYLFRIICRIQTLLGEERRQAVWNLFLLILDFWVVCRLIS